METCNIYYCRVEISNKHFLKTDYVELYSANKIRYYHHNKDKRDEKVLKKKRLVDIFPHICRIN